MAKRLISVLQSAVTTGIAAASAAMPKETGGVLAGWRTSDGLHIVQMLEVPSAKATRTRYVRSQNRANAVLKAFLQGLPAESPVGYVGDWHSHPETQGASRTDLHSIAEFAINDGLPLALIVMVRSADRWELDAWEASAINRRATLRIANTEIITAE